MNNVYFYFFIEVLLSIQKKKNQIQSIGIRVFMLSYCHSWFRESSLGAMMLKDVLETCIIFFVGVDETSLLRLLSQTKMLKSLCLRDTQLVDQALHCFSGSSLEMLDISNTMVSHDLWNLVFSPFSPGEYMNVLYIFDSALYMYCIVYSS